MRLLVRTGAECKLGFSRVVASAPTARNWAALPVLTPYLQIIQFHGHRQLKRKDNSSGDRHRRHRGNKCCHAPRNSGLENMNSIPFWAALNNSAVKAFPLALRTESPMTNCCRHGTLLHFGLQSSHLNNCYYHQDLHQSQLHFGSHLSFAASSTSSYSSTY